MVEDGDPKTFAVDLADVIAPVGTAAPAFGLADSAI
jgi:hypothetical protein